MSTGATIRCCVPCPGPKNGSPAAAHEQPLEKKKRAAVLAVVRLAVPCLWFRRGVHEPNGTTEEGAVNSEGLLRGAALRDDGGARAAGL